MSDAEPTWRVPLAPPRLREEDLAEVTEVYRSGWLTMGPQTERMEAAFREYTGAGEAIALSSCSAALHLAALSADFGPGDRVIVPSLTFAATANAIFNTGAQPLFADIKSVTEPWISVDSVAQVMDAATRGIFVVHYAGLLGEIEALSQLAAEREIHLLEDAAHGSGSWLGDRHAGTFGWAGALSFSGSKNLGVGEGGMLLTDDATVAKQVRDLRWHGLSASSWARHNQQAPEYELRAPGFNYRIDDPRAALIAARLRRLDEDNEARRVIDERFRAALVETDAVVPIASPPAGSRSSHCHFVVDATLDRDLLRRGLAEDGIQTSVHFPPIHQSLGAPAAASLPVTDEFAARAVTLPMFPHMEDWQQELVMESVLRWAGQLTG